ncbi:MAG TPA: hypothetical protein VNZ25_10255 [Candidatus Angelobacter sp.]|jgi:hypothetical protein|nr:hypothetical protein [Candidatus Angelobacter sp.]
MKTLPRILADLALVLISGLIFPRNRDYSDDWGDSRGHPQKRKIKEDVDGIIPVVKEHLKYHPPAT